MAEKLPCRFFQLGICKQGATCSYAHDAGPENKGDAGDVNRNRRTAQNVERQGSNRKAAQVANPPIKRISDNQVKRNLDTQVECDPAQDENRRPNGNAAQAVNSRYNDKARLDAGPNRPRKACQAMALTGRCPRGDACDFSHEKDDIRFLQVANGIAETKINNTRLLQATETDFKKWRYMIPNQPQHMSKQLGPGMVTFFRQALDLVSGEVGIMQETINLLGSEGGLRRVAELMDRDFDKLSPLQLARVFDTQVLPFLKVMTHPNVLGSVILSSRVGTIYNVIFSGDGNRANALFAAAAKHVLTLQSCTLEDDGGVLLTVSNADVDAVESTLAAISKLIEVNTEAQINDGFKHIAGTFATFFKPQMSEEVSFALKPAKKYLRRIEQRLGLGQALPQAASKTKVVGQKAIFQLARDRPGELSEDGARHDNDHVDIRNISILPTLQEIQSPRTEYLPLADPTEWHLGGIEGLCDRNFRLLREDTVGQLRDAAKLELERLQKPELHMEGISSRYQGARTYVYAHVAVLNILMDGRGLEVVLSFAQPQRLAEVSATKRREWWEHSRRMEAEALICLLSSEGSAMFFTVSQESRKPFKRGNMTEPESLFTRFDKHSDPMRAHVIARPVTQSDIHPLIDQSIAGGEAQLSLVEFPGVILPAFMPTLQAMQQMSESQDVPFADILAPRSTKDNPSSDVEVLPPTYATRPGFQYELSSVADDEDSLRLTPGQDLDEMTEFLTSKSTLDHGQAKAIISSLSRSLALIQGPPGTGKSYTGVQLIKILLANKEAGALGPIVCVCFTNHALDQGLERLIDEGVENIIRIGGKSKSERLVDSYLRNVVQKLDLTKTERSDRYNLNKRLDEETQEINNLLARMSKVRGEEAMSAYLSVYDPQHHEEIFGGVDEDGFTRVDYHKGSVVERWIQGGPRVATPPRTIEDLAEEPAANMTNAERKMLFHHWLAEIKDQLHGMLRTALAAYNDVKQKLDDIRLELDLRVLRQANIIGVTTSGLARNLPLLRKVNAKVLVCEEAGEVLESHLLTALLPSVDHAILIGDHQQLRPHVQNYDLSTESRSGGQYALDVSLFERLVEPSDVGAPRLPYCSLNVQRRMHPSISRLVRETLYPNLQDSPSVANYPEVVGMRRRLFWMHHEHIEDQDGDPTLTSHTNTYEVEMTAALVKHLVRQGVYKSDEIAVLTPYLGQLRKIRQKLAGTFNIVLNERDVETLQQDGGNAAEADAALEGNKAPVARGTLLKALRVATVDNFQGEEAKVIVVSLVRSNSKNNVGFLKTTNRINVLLSRAQHGMYILGNAATCETNEMWADVLQMFREGGNLGNALQLSCPRHEDTELVVSTPEDFVRLSPEAGCDLPCDKRLSCGHSCPSKCHAELLHSAIHCTQPCTRPKPGCDHPCSAECGSKCDPVCKEFVACPDTVLRCGHVVTSLPCYQHQHKSKVRCNVMVEKVVPGCKHSVTVPCYVQAENDSYSCTAECGAPLGCSHECTEVCHKCNTREGGKITREVHSQCKQPCGRKSSTCSHRCKAACHGDEDCPLCMEKCDVRCSHSACGKKCHEPCTPCAESNCASHCPHSACAMPCAAPCDWIPCSLRCTLTLACGHQCPSLCGEACPDGNFCQKCASEDIKTMQADMITFEAYGDIDLDEDPCIFTACGHIFTRSSMDDIMDMQKHYHIDTAWSQVTSLKTSSEPFSSEELKLCPTCKGPLRNLSRYGRIVRRASLDESAKKLTVWSNRKHRELADQLSDEQDRLLASLHKEPKPAQIVKLEGSIDHQCMLIYHLQTSRRYRRIYDIRYALNEFIGALHSDEQPYQRVRDLVETARRKNSTAGIKVFDFSSDELQLREHLQAIALLIRCDIIILSDIVNMHGAAEGDARHKSLTLDLEAHRARCEHMIGEAHKTMNVRQEVEGKVFWTRFAAMECGTLDMTNEATIAANLDRMDALKIAATEFLDDAKQMCESYDINGEGSVNPTEGLLEEITDVRRMLLDGAASSEMRMVVNAMAATFRGSGHWYRCVNGHPFTIGECGMPVERARCFTCGAAIGGDDHEPVEGVQHAHDIERQFAGLNVGDD